MFKAATAFSGAGLSAEALKKVGCGLIFGIESDREIANVYQANHGGKVIVSKVEDVELAGLVDIFVKPGELDIFQLSPSCKAFAGVNTRYSPNQNDEIAWAGSAAIINLLRPKIVVIENVKQCLDHPIERRLTQNLAANYNLSHQILNAADFGTPQKRERLFITGTRLDFCTHAKITIPSIKPRDWYAAIADLIKPEDHYVFHAGSWYREGSITHKALPQRLAAIIASTPPSLVPLAIELVGGKGIYPSGMPFHTIRSIGHDGHWHRHVILFPDGSVVKMTPRMLARLMGLGDDFRLPQRDCLAGKVLGNGVCVEIMQAIAHQLLNRIMGPTVKQEYNL